MILILLIVFVFIFSWLMIFVPTGPKRSIGNAISFIVIAGCLIAIVLNDNYHWGLHQVTTTKTETLLPLKSKAAALGVKKLGTGTEKVAVYRTTLQPKTVQHTSATLTTTASLKTGTTATVKTTTTRWRYRGHWAKVFFSLGQPDGKLAKRHYTFTLPKDWHTVTMTTTK
ncbi:DUF4811 domain-containing protein [Lactiplantibacillus daowaiensis]|uniref:DUF4811 domain-containing protein n=1 Tax=Lactiplantibacillus daowaiensis TaxID=2559918 RepID=A0ABW1RXP1_9LACO|nr:DUF4811 domain-containing protein [Lactiplantibacillus daowaiensis]